MSDTDNNGNDAAKRKAARLRAARRRQQAGANSGAKPLAVTMTGPAATGAPVAKAAGRAIRLEPTTRELAQSARPMALRAGAHAWSIEALRIDIAEERRKKRRTFLQRMLIYVVAPTLLAAIYVFLYATPRYISEFQITYQSYGQPSSTSTSGLLSGLMGGSGGAVDMTQVIESYLASDTLLKTLDQQLNLRAHYSDPTIDWLDRLPADAPDEKFLKYFRRRISVDNMVGGYLIVDVESFDRQYSATVASAIAKASDDMVEKLTGRARAEEVRVAEDELKKTQDRLIKATQDVTAFQNEHRDFNPTTGASQLDSVIGTLEGQLSQTRAQLSGAQSFIAGSSPQVAALNSRITALTQQIQEEKRRLASTDSIGSTTSTGQGGATTHGSGVPYSKLVADYTALQLEQNFASSSYLTAKGAYDLAKADSMRKENFVESFVSPNIPEKSMSPNPWTYIPGTFLFCLLAYAVASIMLGSFRDQAG